jgi:hypothetical protein
VSVYCKGVLEASAGYEDMWVQVAVGNIRPWCGDGTPSDRAGWMNLRRRCLATKVQESIEDCLARCSVHPRLIHYVPVAWSTAGIWGINATLYNKKVPAKEAREVGRLLAGGQGLRAGDSRADQEATRHNCCVHCLMNGVKVADTLEHMIFYCPLIEPARSALESAGVSGYTCTEFCTHHRNFWTWSKLRVIRNFFLEAAARRRQARKESPEQWKTPSWF